MLDLINSLQIVMNTERYEVFPGTQDPSVAVYLQPFKLDRDRDKFQTTQSILINPSHRYDIAIFGTEEVNVLKERQKQRNSVFRIS